MTFKRFARYTWGLAITAAGTGCLYGSGCHMTELQAFAAGVETYTNTIAAEEQDSDISFGDWLLDELELDD